MTNEQRGGRQARLCNGQLNPSHAVANTWGKNTAAWRNSKSPSASHSVNILSASLLMAVSWIMLLDNWIYSFGKKKNQIYLGTVGFLFRKQTDKPTLVQAAGCLLRAFLVMILWTEVRLSGSVCGVNGHQDGNKAAPCPADLVRPRCCSFQLTLKCPMSTFAADDASES